MNNWLAITKVKKGPTFMGLEKAAEQFAIIAPEIIQIFQGFDNIFPHQTTLNPAKSNYPTAYHCLMTHSNFPLT